MITNPWNGSRVGNGEMMGFSRGRRRAVQKPTVTRSSVSASAGVVERRFKAA
jgi:hypothetical protein